MLSPHPPSVVHEDYSFECDDGPDIVWNVRGMELVEALSETYSLTVDLVTDADDVDLDPVLGASCRLWIETSTDLRCVPGIAHRLETSRSSDGLLHVRVCVRPAVWTSSQRVDSRAWQHQTVPEILADVLRPPLAEEGRDVVFELRGTYPEREYCVQYRESDLDFAQRLMEEEGLVFFFDHDGRTETMVITDTNDAFPLVPAEHDSPDFVVTQTEPQSQPQGRTIGPPTVWDLRVSQEMTSTSVVRTVCDWRSPRGRMTSEARNTDPRGREREVFDPDEDRASPEHADQLVRRRHEALTSNRRRFRGRSNTTELSPGFVLELLDHDLDADTHYVLTKVIHRGRLPDPTRAEADEEVSGFEYGNSFECVPRSVPLRSRPQRPRPRIHGPQTALVTGPHGEEIHTDEHGRIRVLMRWDRYAPPDDRSSCWVRVAQASAGAGFGTLFVPRVGMEVVVEFLDGDPDRPLVTGCVYSSDAPPPYALPEERTKTTIRTCSSPELESMTYNELCFEDACGREEILLHAARDLRQRVAHDRRSRVEHDDSISVGHDRSVSVGADQTVSITGNHTETVTLAKAETIALAKAETIGLGKALTIGAAYQVSVAGAMNESIGMARSEQVLGTKSSWVRLSSTETVDGSKTSTIGTSSTETVGEDKAITAGATLSLDANEDLSARSGQSITVDAREDVLIGAGRTPVLGDGPMGTVAVAARQDVRIDAGEQMLVDVGAALGIDAETARIEATKTLELRCGKASIILEKDRIILRGTTIDLNP